MTNEQTKITGRVEAELRDEHGNLKARVVTNNLITAVGDQWYAGRAALASGQPGPVTGMKLGTGATAPAKSGGGAALAAYLTDSHQALNGNPAVTAGVATFVATWAPGKATSATAITEVVLINDGLTNATSAAAATISRALLSGIPAKEAGDTLTVTWTHTILGA